MVNLYFMILLYILNMVSFLLLIFRQTVHNYFGTIIIVLLVNYTNYIEYYYHPILL